MPKKFKGENSKAVEARARKAAVEHDKLETKRREAEDALWRDDDKTRAKKDQRKEDKEKKRLEQLEKKKEKQSLYEEEMSAAKSAKPAPVTKVTRNMIDIEQQRLKAEATKKAKKSDDEEPIEENLNRLDLEDGARNVDEALTLMSGREDTDRHPEKRMKAAFSAFEEVTLPRLKEENPTLRLSQLKQLLKKEWMKSPSNPINQKTAAYNSKKK